MKNKKENDYLFIIIISILITCIINNIYNSSKEIRYVYTVRNYVPHYMKCNLGATIIYIY